MASSCRTRVGASRNRVSGITEKKYNLNKGLVSEECEFQDSKLLRAVLLIAIRRAFPGTIAYWYKTTSAGFIEQLFPLLVCSFACCVPPPALLLPSLFRFFLEFSPKMQALLVASALFGLVALTLGAVSPDGRRTPGVTVADVDPNTNVPRDWEAYKQFCKVPTDRTKDAAQKATFLKNVEKVRANQAQQASGRKLAPNFIGMNLNCNSHMTPEEFKKGAFGLLPSPSRDLPTRNRGAAM